MSFLVPGTADADVTASIALGVVLMRLAYSVSFGHGRGSASERRESTAKVTLVVLFGAAAIVGTVLNLGLCHGDAADGTAGWARRSLRAILFMHAPIGHHTAAHLCPHAPRRPSPGPGLGPASMAALGHALLLAAMALLWATHAAMGASWTPFIAVKRGHRLVTWGPFAHVRHPMYTSACLLAAGFAAALGSVAVALAWVPFLWRLTARMPQEEELLVAHYSSAYRSYKKRVAWRICPFVW